MNILISGWYGFKNAGDELLLDVFLEHNKNHNVTVLTQGDISSDKAASVFHADIFRTDSGGIKQWISGKSFRVIKAILAADAFVLGGGGILRESGNFTNLKRLLDEIWLFYALRKKIFIYGVSIGPIKSEKGLKMIKRALLKCDYITVRDEKSVAYLEQFGIDKSKYQMVPDPGFISLPNDSRNMDSNMLNKEVVAQKEIPIFFALGLIDDGNDLSWLDPFARALERINELTGRVFIALPFRCLGEGEIDDVFIGREVKKRLKKSSCLSVYENELEHGELSVVMQRSSCVIAVRLHSMILAIANETPFVAINYDTKVNDTAKVAGLESQVVHLDSVFESSLTESVLSMIENEAEIKRRVSNASKKMSDKAHEIFRVLEHIID